MRTAIVHYWLLNRRGGEKVVEALCRLLPDADIFTLFYDPRAAGTTIGSHKVTASFLNPLRRYYRSLLPLMPVALESLDLRGYDLVISSESGPAKGVITASTTRHVCYCHTPMRYLWELYPAYLHDWTRSAPRRVLTGMFANYLRLWDYASAARVDEFVANSENVRRRIWKAYRREARVVYPPVEVERFHWCPPRDYFLMVTELVPYKQVDMAVRVFGKTGRRLKIAGGGQEMAELRRSAPANVEFCGRVPDEELAELYARCRALVITAEEDFGLTAVEAMASGKPVIALGRGGVRESVPAFDPVAGVFYPEPADESLAEALDIFDTLEPRIDRRELQAHAARFSEEAFLRAMAAILEVPAPEAVGAPLLLD
jgi:glycosyltransferase involved in cell wall biosynthesis